MELSNRRICFFIVGGVIAAWLLSLDADAQTRPSYDQRGAFASIPACNTATPARSYYATDTSVRYNCNGTSWVAENAPPLIVAALAGTAYVFDVNANNAISVDPAAGNATLTFTGTRAVVYVENRSATNTVTFTHPVEGAQVIAPGEVRTIFRDTANGAYKLWGAP